MRRYVLEWRSLALVASVAACSQSDTHAAPDAQMASDAHADVAAMDATAEAQARGTPAFEKHVLDTLFRSEGVAVFDVDKDGHQDLVTDQYWYAGPTFAPHEIRTPETFDGATGYSHCQAAFGDDVDGDGFTDVIVAPFPTEAAYWYANPRGLDVHWTKHVLAPALSATIETPVFVDLFANGHRVLLMGEEPSLVLGWFAPGTDPTAPWVMHPISSLGFVGAGHFVHGLGAGDVDGDGRLDVLTSYGWFQQTADPASWPYHAVSFSSDNCAQMYAWDVDGDGKNDVVCSSAHGYGVWWWRQGPPDAGEPTFVQNLIDGTLSQTHALRLDDLDGDGVPELVTGKRYWAHGPMNDPGAGDPALLLAYALHRDAAGAKFARWVLDTDSGVGTDFAVADVDGDGKLDIAVSNKKGLFFFRQQ
jgi:hypothetical protein